MISFKQFLNEDRPANVKIEWKKTDATLEQAVKWVIANNKTDLASGNFIYRGFEDHDSEPFKFVDPSNSERRSKDSSGIYQMMMDTSRSFQSTPSRSNSFICSTNLDVTKQYGSPCVMFPKKGTPIAISERRDFWASTLGGFAKDCFGDTDIEGMNRRISNMLRNMYSIRDIKDKKVKDIDAAVQQYDIDYFISSLKIESSTATDRIKAEIQAQGGRNYFTALSHLIATPTTFGVETATYGKFKLPPNAEIWFTGKTLVVDEDELKTLLKALPPEIKIASKLQS